MLVSNPARAAASARSASGCTKLRTADGQSAHNARVADADAMREGSGKHSPMELFDRHDAGRRLTQRAEGGRTHLWIVGADGSGLRRLIGGAGSESAPSFRPGR